MMASLLGPTELCPTVLVLLREATAGRVLDAVTVLRVAPCALRRVGREVGWGGGGGAHLL